MVLVVMTRLTKIRISLIIAVLTLLAMRCLSLIVVSLCLWTLSIRMVVVALLLVVVSSMDFGGDLSDQEVHANFMVLQAMILRWHMISFSLPCFCAQSSF